VSDYGELDAVTCEGLRLLREEEAKGQAVDSGAFVPGRFPKKHLI
jgi:hypothetical protein